MTDATRGRPSPRSPAPRRPRSPGPLVAAVVAGAAAGCAAGSSVPPSPRAAPPASDAVVAHTLFLIGDAGAPDPAGEPVLSALRDDVRSEPGRKTVVFLGDNVYPEGLPPAGDDGRADAEARLRAQLAVVADPDVRGIFLPGNHDWADGGSDGWRRIRLQARFVEEEGGPDVSFLPGGGCPGPVAVDGEPGLRIVIVDTSWWLHPAEKPDGPGDGCATWTLRQVADSLRRGVEDAGDRRVVVAAHHPLESEGRHGETSRLTDHLFPLRRVEPWLWVPLPVVGTVVTLLRRESRGSQDHSDPRYSGMRRALKDAIEDRRPLVWAAGHDHNLQVLTGRAVEAHLVSGAGIHGHTTPVRGDDDVRYASDAAGYIRLRFTADGRVRLAVLEVDARGRGREAYAAWIAGAPTAETEVSPAGPP